MPPVFLSLPEVLAIHQDQLARYGGGRGIRNLDLLKSAIAIPAATYDGEFLNPDVYQMAAAYLFHIVKNHPFIDGNKRVGAVAAFVFLSLNGYDLEAPENDLAEMVMAVARGETGKDQVSVFIRKWTRPIY